MIRHNTSRIKFILNTLFVPIYVHKELYCLPDDLSESFKDGVFLSFSIMWVEHFSCNARVNTSYAFWSDCKRSLRNLSFFSFGVFSASISSILLRSQTCSSMKKSLISCCTRFSFKNIQLSFIR